MTGKKEVDPKVLGKKHQSLGPKKLDLKKEKEAVMFMRGLLAEMTAEQAELTGRMDVSLLNRERRRVTDTGQQLRQVNLVAVQLNATFNDYLLDLLDDLDQADQHKAHHLLG